MSSFIMAKGKKTRRTMKKPLRRNSHKTKKLIIALQKLKRMRPPHQREAVKLSNDAFIRDVCTNIKKMRSRPLPMSLTMRMRKQKKQLQKFVRKNTSIAAKRKMLSQRGGFIPLLIAALPALGAMVGNIIGRARRR